MYKCYLNGKFYGTGDLDYMRELFTDYVVKNEMSDREEVNFKIVRLWKVGEEPVGTVIV